MFILRWRYNWHRWDENGDGILTREEFIDTGKKIASLNNVPWEGRMKSNTNQIWDMWTMGNPELSKEVTWNAWGPTAIQILKMPDAPKLMEPVNKTFFEWMDADGNGTMSIDEYTNFLSTQGKFTEEQIQRAYKSFHPNEDNEITKENYMFAFNECAFSQKPDCPYKMTIQGPSPEDPDLLKLHPWTGVPLSDLGVQDLEF